MAIGVREKDKAQLVVEVVREKGGLRDNFLEEAI